MLALSTDDIKTLMPMEKAITLVAQAMVATSNGKATLPLRHAMPLEAGNMLGIMPGALQDPPCHGSKLISLYPNNPGKGYSSHLGLMVLFERRFGQPVAIMDAGLLTALRTAAASAVATDTLARKNAKTLAIIGLGEQAAFHIRAILAVRPITEIRVTGRSPAKATTFARRQQALYPDLDIIATSSARQAVAGADIICTVTSSPTTVLKGAWVSPGAHVNAVGASVPSLREIDQEMVTKATLFVDYRPSALNQARDIIKALETGAITESHIKGEIGEVLGGQVEGRADGADITLYRSLGIAAQDLICAHYIMEEAKKQGCGQDISIF